MMTFGSLFAGIGGFDLGFERAGMRCIWQVENDDYCNRVLAKHWPRVRRYGDIREVTGAMLERPDIICGGFPCQDISNAGKRAGIDGDRSGLWSEMCRLVREVRPQIVVVENVAALLVRGMGRVLGDLAESGYDAEWGCIPACAVGAPHIRNRVFILAYAPSIRREYHKSQPGGDDQSENKRGMRQLAGTCAHVANAAGKHCDYSFRSWGEAVEWKLGRFGRRARQHWSVEPDVGRVANGIPNRTHRLRGLGNAVVPQVAEFIGRLIVEAA